MAEKAGNKAAKEFCLDVPYPEQNFHVRGMGHVDWGVKDRLSRIFSPKSGRTVMLAFDHGYIMGPTSGLERMDITMPPLIPYADCLMCTRGALRSIVPPTSGKPICLRSSAGTTILNDLNDECVMGMEEAIRLNATAMAVMISVGGKYEGQTMQNFFRLVDQGNRYGIPIMGVTAVGKELTRDARYLGMASRVLAENGASLVKTYYCEPDFEEVVAGCPVPIVIAGGKKVPEAQALEIAYNAIQAGAAGVDMGRNVFQAEAPVPMIKAIHAVVHDGLTPKEGLDLYNTLKNEA